MLREIVEEILKPIVKVEEIKKYLVFEPDQRKFDNKILKTGEGFYSGMFKNGNINVGEEFIKIEVFDENEKSALKTLNKEIKKLEKSGYKLAWSQRVGTKGQNWKGLIWKYGSMYTAIMYK